MHRPRFFCVAFSVLLIASSSSNALAYWPIVFQVAKEGAEFTFVQGPHQLAEGKLSLNPSNSSIETIVSYDFVLREFVSFSEEILKATEAYLQLYPADVRAHEYGKTGHVYFNGAIIKRFNLTCSCPEEEFFFDGSNYRFTQSMLDFPIPMYRHFSNSSLFIPVSTSLLATHINATFRMDPNVMWDVYVISIIVHIVHEEVSPWWLENLPIICGIVSAEIICIAFAARTLRKLLPEEKESYSHKSLL